MWFRFWFWDNQFWNGDLNWLDICPCKVFYTYCVVTSGRSSFLNPLMAGFVASCPKTSSNLTQGLEVDSLKRTVKSTLWNKSALSTVKTLIYRWQRSLHYTMPLTKPILQSHLLFHLCNFIQANKDWVSWKLLRQGFYSLMLLKRIQT